MTPGFIDLSFVSRGYEKAEPLYLPKSYDYYHFYRNLGEAINLDLTPLNFYTGRTPDDFSSNMISLEDRYNKTQTLTRLYLQELRKGKLQAQEDATLNTEGTPEEISTNSLTTTLSPEMQAATTPNTNGQSTL